MFTKGLKNLRDYLLRIWSRKPSHVPTKNVQKECSALTKELEMLSAKLVQLSIAQYVCSQLIQKHATKNISWPIFKQS